MSKGIMAVPVPGRPRTSPGSAARLVAAAASLLAFLQPAAPKAHHAMEYIEMESYTTPRRGEFVFHLHYDYMVEDAGNPRLDHWELTPGFSAGVADRLMFDLHTHFAKFGVDHLAESSEEYWPNGPSPFMEALAASLQIRVTEGWLLDVAFGLGFEVPFGRSRELLGSEGNVYAGMLIIGKELPGHRNITGNLVYETEGEEDATLWALGFKTPLTSDQHGISAGVEIMGMFEEAGDNWSVLPGVYLPLGSRRLTLKTGIEIGKAGGADMLRSNLTLMCLF